MDFGQILAVSGAGMDLERARLDAAAMNLANQHTTRTSNGGHYLPVRVVATSSSQGGFSASLDRVSVPVSTYVTEYQHVSPRISFEPGHPDANESGFVTYPGVDPMQEMVNVSSAVRAYEANVMVINAAKAMSNKALEIGGGS